MPYDPGLAVRLADMVEDHPGLTLKKMFGGIGYLLNGNMCVGVHRDCLMLRLGEELAATVLKNPGTKPMDLTGKVMKGWVTVLPEGLEDDATVQGYVDLSVKFVSTLPAKESPPA